MMRGPRAHLWEKAFPNGRHIFMTRRNKVRLAVSWWKAIQSDEWHRQAGGISKVTDIEDAYSFEAIHHLYCESVVRECGIQEFFAEAGIIPLTIAYEDYLQDYEATVERILGYLEIDLVDVTIAPPYYDRLADETSAVWTARFRDELQKGWPNRGW
jgi:trehalose 2-sulfotransferase